MKHRLGAKSNIVLIYLLTHKIFNLAITRKRRDTALEFWEDTVLET
jgi:hypothetical protein